MAKRVLVLALTAGAVLLEGGFHKRPAQPWIEFQSKEGGFSILMPHKPTRQTNPPPAGAGTTESVMFTASTDEAFYGVIYSDFPAAPSNPEEANRLLDGRRDGSLAQANGRLISESRITLDGHLGREIKVKVEAGYLFARIYLVRRRLFQIITAQKTEALSEGATRFFNSFKLVDR